MLPWCGRNEVTCRPIFQLLASFSNQNCTAQNVMAGKSLFLEVADGGRERRNSIAQVAKCARTPCEQLKMARKGTATVGKRLF